MKLILIRHGESMANVGEMGEANGLTVKGKEQAKNLAMYLGDNKIDHFYCSNTTRSIETLTELLKDRGEEVKVYISRLIGPKMTSETMENLKRRTIRFIEDLKIEFGEEETVAVISHKTTLRTMCFLISGEDRIFDNATAVMIELKTATLNNLATSYDEMDA
ncbi:MAG: phosphoglycerate mutase family protein [Candidatus Shapirobacteria bacterium]